MSYTETHIGKLIKITPPDNIDSWFAKLNIDPTVSDIHDNYTLYYTREDIPLVIITTSGDIFMIQDTLLEDDDICEFKKINSCEYNYVFRFYNGGTCFWKQLTDKLNKTSF